MNSPFRRTRKYLRHPQAATAQMRCRVPSCWTTVIVVMENTSDASNIGGNTMQAPYINSLAEDGATSATRTR